MIERLLRHRRGVLIGYAVLLVPALWLCSRLPLQTDLLQLLPPDVPEVRALRLLQNWGVTVGYTYVGLLADEGTSPEVLKDVAATAIEELRANPLVDHFDEGYDVPFMERAALLRLEPDDVPQLAQGLRDYIKAEKRRRSGLDLGLDDGATDEESNPFGGLLDKYARRFQLSPDAGGGSGSALDEVYKRLDSTKTKVRYVSSDGKMLLFALKPKFATSDDAKTAVLLEDVHRAVQKGRAKHPEAKLEYLVGGGYPLEHEQRLTIANDALRSALLGAAAILLIVAFTLRRWRSIVAVFGTLAASIAFTFGIVEIVTGSVNMITVFLLAILAGLGVDFGLYFVTRRDMLLAEGKSPVEATRESWRQTAAPSALGAVTTMCVFALLAFAQFRGFSQLGYISAIGIVSAWLGMYIVLPCLMMNVHHDPPRPKPLPPWMAKVPRLQTGVVFVAAVVITLLAALSGSRVRFAFEGNELTVEGQKSLLIDKEIAEHLGENIDRVVVIAETEERGRRIQQWFEENYGRIKDIARYDSAFGWIATPAQQAAVREKFPELRDALQQLPRRNPDPATDWLLKSARALEELPEQTVADIPPAWRKRHVGYGEDGKPVGYIGLISPKSSLWDIRSLEEFVALVNSLRVDGEPLHVTGRAHMFAVVIDMVRREAQWFSVLGLLLVGGLMWLQLRRAGLALLSLLPLVAGLSWTLGAMPYVAGGLNITFLNVIVFPVLIGLGVSYGIQIVYAFRIYGTAERAISVVRRAVLGSSTTTLAGWATLLWASMIGLRGMGWLATLGMLSVTGFSLFVLPAVLDVLHRRGLLKPDMVQAEAAGTDAERAA